jgi:membrane protein DedA with SNARE-associated domain
VPEPRDRAADPSPVFQSTLPEPHETVERHVPVSAEVREPAVDELPKRRRKPAEPELPEIHRADVLCIGPIMANTLYGLFGRGIFFALVKTNLPLLLVIRSSIPALIAAGAAVKEGTLPLWVPLLVSVPYLFFDDPFIYWAGRRYGDRLTGYLIEQDPRWKKRIARGERVMERWGFWAIIICNIPFVPIPVSIIYFIAGDSRMSIKLFLIADLISLEMLIGSSVFLGYALGDTAQSVVDAIGRYSGYLFWATMALIAVSVVVSVRRSLRQMREQETRDDDD